METSETYQFTVGSGEGCELIINHKSVSRVHAKIYFSGDSILVEDLNSRQGTFVLYNGEFKRIRSAKIRPDTEIRFGSSLEGVLAKEVIENYKNLKAKERKDISRKVKSVGHKRCQDCGSVMEKNKIHCDCCGAIFDESA